MPILFVIRLLLLLLSRWLSGLMALIVADLNYCEPIRAVPHHIGKQLNGIT